MELFLGIMKIIWNGLNRPFELWGYSISFANCIYLLMAATVVAIIIKGIFDN